MILKVYKYKYLPADISFTSEIWEFKKCLKFSFFIPTIHFISFLNPVKIFRNKILRFYIGKRKFQKNPCECWAKINFGPISVIGFCDAKISVIGFCDAKKLELFI